MARDNDEIMQVNAELEDDGFLNEAVEIIRGAK